MNPLRLRLSCALAVAITLFCAPPAIAVETDPGDGLLVVDCLLPGQVRRLGNRTYLSARRPVQTTAQECRIRGGEYVASDRASLSSALSVWLAAAKNGDVDAMITVGQSYEKGFGLEPDYPAAAYWYQRAAGTGDTRAQINLAQLYERGLGVPQDPERAKRLYRLASDVDIDVALDPGIAGMTAGVSAASLEEENAVLREQMAVLEGQAARLGSDLALTEQELEQAREALEDAQAEASRSSSSAAATSRYRTEVEARVADKERQLRDLRQRLADYQRRQAQLESQTEQAQRDLAQARRRLGESEGALADSRSELERALDRLGSYEQASAEEQAEVELLRRRVAENEAELRRRREAIEQTNTAAETLRARVETYERMLAAREAVEAARESRSLAAPSITLVDPQLPATRDVTPTVRVRSDLPSRQVIGLLDAAAGLLSLTINDAPVAVDESGIFRSEIALRTEPVSVSIVAIDRQGKRSSREFVLEPVIERAEAVTPKPPAPPQPYVPPLDFGNYHALVIGIDDYSRLPRLRTAVNDANAVAALLQKRYGFEVQKLLNPTRYDILSALNDLRETLNSDDNLLIYYAGHGELDRINMRGHWLPVDAEPDNTANWISNVAVTDVLNIMNAGKILVVADSCYSGSLTRSALTQLEGKLTKAEQTAWLERLIDKRSRTVLTSGGLKPTLDEGAADHSVFAAAFLNVLESADEVLPGLRLYREVSARVAYAAASMRFEQVPEYAPMKFTGHEGGDFFLVPGLRPGD